MAIGAALGGQYRGGRMLSVVPGGLMRAVGRTTTAMTDAT